MTTFRRRWWRTKSRCVIEQVSPDEMESSLRRYEIDLLRWRIQSMRKIETLVQTHDWPTTPGSSLRAALPNCAVAR
jgi:hypothetical protein